MNIVVVAGNVNLRKNCFTANEKTWIEVMFYKPNTILRIYKTHWKIKLRDVCISHYTNIHLCASRKKYKIYISANGLF